MTNSSLSWRKHKSVWLETHFITYTIWKCSSHSAILHIVLKAEVASVLRKLVNSYRGYTASIEFSEDENVYIGIVKDIAEGFRGRTIDEALKRFHSVVDRHINIGG